VLFAGLEGERERPAVGRVLADPDKTAGNLPEVVLARRKETETHSVTRREAEHACVADDDVSTDVDGLLEQGQRDRIRAERIERVVVVSEVADRREVLLDRPAHGRILDVDHHDLFVDGRLEPREVDVPVVDGYSSTTRSVPAT